jgi:hypothetical protein
MNGVGRSSRSNKQRQHARWKSRLLPAVLITACVSLVACMSGLPAKSADLQKAPPAQVSQNSVDSQASSKGEQSPAPSVPKVDQPAARQKDVMPDLVRDEAAAVHRGTSTATAPESEAVTYVETLLHSSEEKGAEEGVQPVAEPTPLTSHAPVDVAPVRPSRSHTYSDLWWLAVLVASLVILGVWLMRRRKPSPRVPDHMELRFERAAKPDPQESAPVVEVLQESVAEAPLSVETESSPVIVSPTVAVLNTDSFVPRAAVQAILAPLPLQAEQVALAPARDLRRARSLLQTGELDAALAYVLPCLLELRGESSAGDAVARPQILPDAFYLNESHPTARATAALYADICWRLARRNRCSDDHTQAVCALETYLVFRPEDMTARLRLARSLLDLSELQTNAVTQESLRQYCMEVLLQRLKFEPPQEQALLGLLGEVLCQSALQAPVIDQAEQAEAEKLLRQAIAMGPMPDTDAAWWLQKSLTTLLPGMKPDAAVARLDEAIALLHDGVAATAAMPECSRWQAALLRAELKQAQSSPSSVLELRLRLRSLHDRYLEQMQTESSPKVLAAWVELLCAMADPLVGAAAKTRYGEIDDVLERLSVRDASGDLHASTWMRMAQGRLRVENGAGRRSLLQRAESLLLPSLANADPVLRIEASRLALTQAVQENDPEAKHAAYAKALAFALPMVNVTPALAASALCCALKVVLALGKNEQRRSFAASLSQLMPDDVESLGLLAASAEQDGAPTDACRYLARAAQAQTALSSDLLTLWQTASMSWATQSGKDAEWQANYRQLRWAASRIR